MEMRGREDQVGDHQSWRSTRIRGRPSSYQLRRRSPATHGAGRCQSEHYIRMICITDDPAPGKAAILAFIPGLALSSAFYTEIVAPILADAYPQLRYAAALIGYGSEVLGYDTARSTDHEWGPRLLLFVSDDDYAARAEAIQTLLGQRLPSTFRGFPRTLGHQAPMACNKPRPSPLVPSCTRSRSIPAWSADPLARCRSSLATLTAVDWLLMPQQKLLEVIAGRVFHDGLGELEPIRANSSHSRPVSGGTSWPRSGRGFRSRRRSWARRRGG